MGANTTGPRNWGFLPLGPTSMVTLGASTTTVTLSTFVTTGPAAPMMCFQASGAAATNSFATVAFGTAVTLSSTVGTPITSVQLLSQHGQSNRVDGDGQKTILSTGKSPTNVFTIGSAGTMTVWVTPGEGSF